MNDRDLVEKLKSTFRKNSTQLKVFNLLSDREWHCRSCEGKNIASEQYAGGGGIQGLQRGTKSRPGLEIKTERKFCNTCQKQTTWDCWTGKIKAANAPTNIPLELVEKILSVYSYIDVIEQRQRPRHEIIIDHRFPMERWGNVEETHNLNMSETEIKQKFQLLKKDSAGNHNLLKSRSCEFCIKTCKRGTPLGIKFWYQGNENWPHNIPKIGKDAETGCIGCGWYNFDIWRDTLNQKLTEFKQDN